MGRAEDLFKRLVTQGESEIDTLIAEAQSEELFLEFKRANNEGSGSRLHPDDRKNLARAISGFGNSEGGVVFWGIECTGNSPRGDVAARRVPIQDPQRFKSWLENAVSGCTIPPHPSVRHHVIESRQTGYGYVVTLVPRSYLAPHQCIQPQQFLIRVGSNFEPTPYGVLAGMFGKAPQAFVFHQWVVSTKPDRSQGDPIIHLQAGFQLGNRGPGVVRDLFANLLWRSPGGATEIGVTPAEDRSWTGHRLFGNQVIQMVSVDSYKLAPMARAQPFTLGLFLKLPIERGLDYSITFGAGAGPTREWKWNITRADLEAAIHAFLVSDGGDQAKTALYEQVLGIKDPENDDPDFYDSQTMAGS